MMESVLSKVARISWSIQYYKYYSHIGYLQYINTNRLIWCNIFPEISSKIINNNNNKSTSTYTQIHLNKKIWNISTFQFFFCLYVWFSLRNSVSLKFYKNPKFCWKVWHNLQTRLSQCQFFIFNLKSCKEVATLYSLGRFAQRNGVLFDIFLFRILLFSYFH